MSEPTNERTVVVTFRDRVAARLWDDLSDERAIAWLRDPDICTVTRPAEPTFPGYPDRVTNRILWNVRGGDIDEIVISNCAVHVEQMDRRCWWIGITRADGGYWAGNFVADSRGRMTFTEQEREGFEWDHTGAHRERSAT